MIVFVSKKFLAITFVIVTMAVLFLATYLAVNVITHQDYITLKADVDSVYTVRSSNKNSSGQDYAHIRYSIDETQYTCEYSLWFFHNVGAGDIIDIRVNPDDYSDVEDQVQIYGTILFISFLLLFDVFLIAALISKRRKFRDYNKNKNELSNYRKDSMF